jgi:uncharacterized protein (DUF952 family)
MIFHVTTQNNWEDALKNGFYAAPSLHSEGFIHMSMKHQVQGVLERYYQGMKNLVLLHIDESKLKAELKYELSPSVNQEFPHLFGTLNVDAVVEVEPL